MDKKYNQKLIANARELRKSMTPQERRLWFGYLKDCPVKFLRQKVMGKYIIDFYCPKLKLAIELDGSQHYDPEGMEYDNCRTEYLNRYGINVIRIPNNEIDHNLSGVCDYIADFFPDDI